MELKLGIYVINSVSNDACCHIQRDSHIFSALKVSWHVHKKSMFVNSLKILHKEIGELPIVKHIPSSFVLQNGYDSEPWPIRQAAILQDGSTTVVPWNGRRCLQCEAPKIAKLIYNCNNYGFWMFMVFITIVTGAYKPTYNWGGLTLYGCLEIPSIVHVHMRGLCALKHFMAIYNR